MRDLDIRGAGNLLGAEQSGFITDLGFEMYHKILDEAIQELKETEYRDLFLPSLENVAKTLVRDCTIESDLEMLIPEEYVNNISERLSLYTQLDSIKNEEKLEGFISSMRDRFGPIPPSVLDLIETVRLRWLAEKLGFEKLNLKNGALKAYFLPAEKVEYYKSEIFGKILTFVQMHSRRCRMRDLKGKLILNVDNIKSISEAKSLLEAMYS